MTKEEILSEQPGLSAEQITIELASTATTNNIQAGALICPSLRWVGDEGSMSVMEATSTVRVRVDHTRDGQWKGAVFVDMNPNDRLRILQNRDNRNYDSYSC